MKQINRQTTEPWSVSELNLKAKDLLEQEFCFVWVQGEISNLMQPKSGHLYFTIKDDRAQISCVWLKYYHSNNVNQIKNGKKWWFKGKVSLYQERGNYQLIVNYAEEFGIGEKQLLLAQKKQDLIDKGWVNSNHKKELPQVAKEIALVTSSSGAAVQDMIKVIRTRMPATKITIVPCLVQGTEAATSIAKAIANANQNSTADLIIVGRGGGSIEDLWAYNEDPVIEAIFHSKKPIITGIGHESDHTLAELVADFRAATPSAAAEQATLERSDIIQKLDLYTLVLNKKVLEQYNKAKMHLSLLRKCCIEPSQAIQNKRLKILHLRQKLDRNIIYKANNNQQKLAYLYQQISALNPSNLLAKGYCLLKQNDKIIAKGKSASKNQLITIESAEFIYIAQIIDKEKIQ